MNDNGVNNYNGKYKYQATYSVGNRTTTRNSKNSNNSDKKVITVIAIIFAAVLCISFISSFVKTTDLYQNLFKDKSFTILSTYENKDMEKDIIEYGKKNKIDITFEYAEDLDAVSMLNDDASKYDAIWFSNSLWVYQVEKAKISNSKSISINPIVMAVKYKKAKELDLVGKDITNATLVKLVQEGKIKYVMSSVVRTNSGASSYLGTLTALAGQPEVLTSDMLENVNLRNNLTKYFSSTERVSGTNTFLEDMFLNSDDYEAVIAAETSLIRINQQLKDKGKDQLYLLYPTDGVPIADSPFAYVDNGQEKTEYFDTIQKYLLSNDMQKKLENAGRRTWYGGTNDKANQEVFNPSWGIDTNKYLIAFKYPSKQVIKEATALYVDYFRKPAHVVFLLDFSGSMYGDGNKQLTAAMSYILNYDDASKDYLQFSSKDTVTVIPFNSQVLATWTTKDGKQTGQIVNNVVSYIPGGGTDIYTASVRGLQILEADKRDITKTIVLMTDGQSQSNYYTLESTYKYLESKIPIYSIMFGDARESQLREIANLTNGKVFDGKKDLLKAFKEVRSFN
jgi:Ca-activated chloride channel family protein